MTFRIVLDADGVLLDFQQPTLDIINGLMGTHHTMDEIKIWDLFEALDVPDDILKQVFREIKSPGWCRNLQPFPGTVDAIHRLSQICPELLVVTSPFNSPTWTHERERCLMAHFDLDRKQIIHADAKWAISANVFIDDKTENCEMWRQCHPGGVAIRWKCHYSAVDEPWDGVTMSDWNMLTDAIQHLKSASLPQVWRHRSVT